MDTQKSVFLIATGKTKDLVNSRGVAQLDRFFQLALDKAMVPPGPY